MGAALSLLVILSLAITVIRVAAVALRLTGLPADVARFQARSAFTGAGFTTSESESVVNYPVRRRVISVLMVVGNIGLVTVLSTIVVSFLSVENSMSGFSQQLLWLLGTLAILWLIALNPFADRLMCRAIGWILHRADFLGQHGPTNLLQVSNGHDVAEHRVLSGSKAEGALLSNLQLAEQQLLLLGLRHDDGRYQSTPSPDTRLKSGDRLVVYGDDDRQSSFYRELFRLQD